MRKAINDRLLILISLLFNLVSFKNPRHCLFGGRYHIMGMIGLPLGTKELRKKRPAFYVSPAPQSALSVQLSPLSLYRIRVLILPIV